MVRLRHWLLVSCFCWSALFYITLLLCSTQRQSVTINFRMRRLLVKLSELAKSVPKMVTGCCKNDKSCYICNIRPKRLLVKYEKFGTLWIYFVCSRQKEGRHIINIRIIKIHFHIAINVTYSRQWSYVLLFWKTFLGVFDLPICH